MKVRLLALGGSVAAIGGLAVTASGATGAYFSQSVPGTISGTLGKISVATSGGNGDNAQDFSWNNILPGVPNQAVVNYQNTGINNEDVYLVFQNKTALSALNNLGTYGEVHITTAGTGTANAQVFTSTNLNDNLTSCGFFAPTAGVTPPVPCWPVPNVIPVATNITGGSTGAVTFEFNYASKLASGQGGTFNLYPVVGQQNFVGAALTNSGLPYEIVAVQAGAPAPTVS